MARNGSKNLKSFSNLAEDAHKIICKKGGIASGAARREKKTLRQRLELLLKVQDETSGQENADAITTALINKALAGDVKAFEVIRDTVGEKPTDKVDSITNGTLVIKWQE